MALGLQPCRALLNDANPHLIHFYRWVKRGLQIQIPMKNRESAFYGHRARFNQLLDEGRESSAEAAALFYYLNRTGYNGLCRFNQQGRFNVPFGRYARISYRHDFTEYRATFARWRFLDRDVIEVPTAPTDFIYADPPYDVPFTQYVKGGFRWSQQVESATWLAHHSGPVVLTNQATDRIVCLYQRLGFTLRFLRAPRMISCTGERPTVREVLATRNL